MTVLKTSRFFTTQSKLLAVQRESFLWFLHEGYKNFPYFEHNFDYSYIGAFGVIRCLNKPFILRKPLLTPDEALRHGLTYQASCYLACKAQVIYTPKQVVVQAKTSPNAKNHVKHIYQRPLSFIFPMYIGHLPLMTEYGGTFILRGIKRTFIHQIVRGPGLYYTVKFNDKGHKFYNLQFVFLYQSWLRIRARRAIVGTRNMRHEVLYYSTELLPGREILISHLLVALGFTKQQIFTNPYYYDHGILHDSFVQTPSETLTQAQALRDIAKTLGFTGTRRTAKAAYFIRERFISPTRGFRLGLFGRRSVNEKLGIKSQRGITLTPEDILLSIQQLSLIKEGLRELDNIDHLKNRRIRAVGEILAQTFSTQVRDRWASESARSSTSPYKVRWYSTQKRSSKRQTKSMFHGLINILFRQWLKGIYTQRKLIRYSWNKVFSLNPLSQMLDETNALASVTHKRRISCLGPGGLKRENAGFQVRDIHASYYGRLCPIETPEGQNAGLVSSLALYARTDRMGFLESPTLRVKYRRCQILPDLNYYAANEDYHFYKAASDTVFKRKSFQIQQPKLFGRYHESFLLFNQKAITCVDLSPCSALSIATALIPFIEHDDANRALMGSNMQRQAIPLIKGERPFVGTGLEATVIQNSSTSLFAEESGCIVEVKSNTIYTRPTWKKHALKAPTLNNVIGRARSRFSNLNQVARDGWKAYHLTNHLRTNQGISSYQRFCHQVGSKIKRGALIGEGFTSDGGEFAVGKNILVAYMPWEGYNFEDALIISEKCIKNDFYTSLHVKKFEANFRKSSRRYEILSRDIPGPKFHLTEQGIAHKGAFVRGGDILIGRESLAYEQQPSPEERLLQAIYNIPLPHGRDTSLRLSGYKSGRVLSIQQKDEQGIRVNVGYHHRLQVGDKMAGRHGNKGIIALVLPEKDMPHLQDGTPVDMLLNPLGVPSRMNVGQIYEGLLGLATSILGYQVRTMPFDEMFGKEASRGLIYQKLADAYQSSKLQWLFEPSNPGKSIIIDGRSGKPFDQPVMVTKSYMLKLNHLVEHKIHARSTGPYSLITQQPVGGRAKNGGQRFGEMEVWALEGFGAAYTLHELLTLKSDDLLGRERVFNSVLKKTNFPFPATPESFLVLMRELRGLCLDTQGWKKLPAQFENSL